MKAQPSTIHFFFTNDFPLAILTFTILCSCLATAQNSQASLAPTPPMGWASWNYYFCDYDEQTIRDQADAMVSTDMRDLGYHYLIIQECIAPSRDASGQVVPDSKRFPHGIPALVDYIHARGLKAGIYTDVGPYTCYSKTHYEGSYDHESQDAQTFANWGIDLIEVDYCNKPKNHSGRELYGRMAEGIRKTGRPMLLYICSWGEERPWEWAPGMAQLWRTTEDISYEANRVAWSAVVRNFELNAAQAAFTAPNGWNDPDMLEVGNRGLTPDEARSHFSMWTISSAPLWAGTDLSHLDAEARAIYTNAEAIAVDQDALGAGLRRVSQKNGVEVWAKPLGKWTGETQAILLLNLNSSSTSAEIRWNELGLAPNAAAHDLWAHKDLGQLGDGYSTELQAHASAFLKISGALANGGRTVYEAEWPGNVRPGDAVPVKCEACSGGYALALKPSKEALIFADIDSDAGSDREVSIDYSGSSSKVLPVIINGEAVNFDTPRSSGTTSHIVKLRAGSNRVEIRPSTPIQIDCLVLHR
ncbi:MAG TPA: alpha-galactosidase [Candidatus Sulfotelmatobacter sp.]|nr:alpha-galactosidase [Candidatus Sulfotelmatobacter sp.]